MEVCARGSSFHLIVGHHTYGSSYLCIPDWSIGSELSSLGDVFWNQEQLKNYTKLKSVDACSVASALAAFKEYREATM
ncbi:MAG: DUF6618 family protein [Eubacteriales bacterium]